MPESVPPSIREELDQTPAWWDRQYNALVRKQTPTRPEDHEGHEWDELLTYDDTVVLRRCLDCGIDIDR